MSQGMVRLVTQTINDLYFAVTVRGVEIPLVSLVKGALAGIVGDGGDGGLAGLGSSLCAAARGAFAFQPGEPKPAAP